MARIQREHWDEFKAYALQDAKLCVRYPTAMSFMRLPDWTNLTETKDPADYHFTDYGYARLDFEFPDSVRFPTLPVRTNHGLVFPRKGRSNCAAPEIALAVQLGAKVVFPRVLPFHTLYRTDTS